MTNIARIVLLSLVVVVASLTPVSANAAAGAGGETPSAVDEYIEGYPSGGKTSPKKTKIAPLSRSTYEALGSVDQGAAEALTEVATSPDLGAPGTKLKAPSKRQADEVTGASFLGGLEEAGASMLNGGALLLFAGLAAIAIGAVALTRTAKRNS